MMVISECRYILFGKTFDGFKQVSNDYNELALVSTKSVGAMTSIRTKNVVHAFSAVSK